MLATTPARAQSSGEPSSIERTVPTVGTKEPERTSTSVSVDPERAERARFDGTFVLGAVVINGATVFTSKTLAADFEPLLASAIGEQQLDEIVGRITRRYRAAGYLLSYATLPAQDIKSGIVRIDVVEGFVADVRFEGAGRELAALRAIASPLLADRPLRSNTLERVVGLLRDVPGAAVAEVRISRSVSAAGGHALTVVIARDAERALLYADNRGTIDGARARLYSSFSRASTLLPGDQLQLNLFAIPGHGYRFLYGQALASAPLGHEGLRLGGAISLGDQRVGSGTDRSDGASRNLTAQISYPFVKRRQLSVTGRIALNDWRSIDRNDDALFQRDHLRAARLIVDGSHVAASRIDAQLVLSQGIGFDKATRKGDPLASRNDASGRFTKFNFDLQGTWPLSKSISMRASLTGQYSTRPLLSIEEYALGGNRIGRGYDFNALTGDHGFGGAVELGNRVGNIAHGPQQIELFVFGDGGAVFQSGRSGINRRQSLASIGAGGRFSVLGLAFTAEIGVPLVAVNGARSARGFISVAKAF